MNPTSNGEFSQIVYHVYPAWSLLWAVLWAKVAFHYGKAAWLTWKINGVTWKGIACDIFDPLMFAVRDFFCRWEWGCRLFKVERNDLTGKIIPTSSPGNILRFAIFVASMTPISYGLAFAFVEVWRAEPWKLFVTMLFMFTSILGALGHLFLAHRSNPPYWSTVVSLSILWFLLGPFVFYIGRSLL